MLDNARLQLSYCTVTAPIDGRAGSVLVYPGNMVKGNDDKPLVVLQPGQPRVRLLLGARRPSAAIRASTPARPEAEGRRVPGGGTVAARRLSRGADVLDNAVDTTTGTILLKATFANADERALARRVRRTSLLDARDRAGRRRRPVAGGPERARPGQYVYVVKSDMTVGDRARSPCQRTADRSSVVDQAACAGRARRHRRAAAPGAPARKVEIKQAAGKAPREHRRDLHPAPRHDDARHGGHPHLRRHGLPAASDLGPAQRGLPDDPGLGVSCRAPRPRPWRPRSRRRSSGSSRRSRAWTT